MSPKNDIQIVIAAANGDCAGVEQCLISGTFANACDDFGRTALHEAAARNDIRILKLLMSNGADPNAACVDGWTPLCEAAKYNSVEAFKILLESGGRVDLPHPSSVYDVAIRFGAGMEIFNLLLPKLKPDMLDKKGHPIVEAAIRNNRADVVSALEQLGANISQSMECIAEAEKKRAFALEKRVLVDLDFSREPVQATLIVGWDMEKLWEGGPVGPVREFIELHQGMTPLFRCEMPTRRGTEYPCHLIILHMREKVWQAGYYPRLAVFHPRLEITGLTHECGGYIDEGTYYYLDEVITRPC